MAAPAAPPLDDGMGPEEVTESRKRLLDELRLTHGFSEKEVVSLLADQSVLTWADLAVMTRQQWSTLAGRIPQHRIAEMMAAGTWEEGQRLFYEDCANPRRLAPGHMNSLDQLAKRARRELRRQVRCQSANAHSRIREVRAASSGESGQAELTTLNIENVDMHNTMTAVREEAGRESSEDAAPSGARSV